MPTPDEKNDQLVEDLRRAFELIDSNFSRVYSKADTTGKALLVASRDAARDAYFKAVADKLSDDNAMLQKLEAELDDERATLEKQLKSLKDIAGTINQIGAVAKTLSAIAQVAAVA